MSGSFGGGGFSIDIRTFFFDGPLVQRALREMRTDAGAFEQYARYLRKVAIRSIRKVRAKPGGKAFNRPSRPNTPPRSRDPQHRLRKIYYGFDTSLMATIVGPVFLRRTSTTTVPAIHEKGKRVVITKNVYKQRGSKARSRAQAESYKRLLASGRIPYPKPVGTQTIVANYPERQFMWPAAKKTIHKFPNMYAAGVSMG